MRIFVERVEEVSQHVWRFLPPIDPYYVQISDVIRWGLYENFADVLTCAGLQVALGMGPVRTDHVNAQQVLPFCMTHRGCAWYHGYRHITYTAMVEHIYSDFPPNLVHGI